MGTPPLASRRSVDRWDDPDMIGRLHHVIIDCPDPGVLAEFYAELVGLR